MADISTALFVLKQAANLSPAVAVVESPMRHTPLWRRIVIPATAALFSAAAGSAVVWNGMRSAPPRISHLSIPFSGTTALSINGNDRDLAITPDGARVVYVGNNGTQLFVRALDDPEPIAVFTGAPREPFVSPDGEWIGFADNNVSLKKVAITGGPPVVLATLDGGGARGGTWAPDDTIIVATNNPTTGLQRLSAAGGTPTPLTRPQRAQGEGDHLWPEILPGGRAVLFTIMPVSGGLDAAQVAVLDLQTGMRKVLVRGGSHGHYVRTGHLVYAAAGSLRAVRFDLSTLTAKGTPVPVVPDVVTTNVGSLDAVVATNGTLAYVSGGPAGGLQRTLVWVDRQGHETTIPMPPRVYNYPRLSPDGTQVALSATDQESDIWLWDLRRATLTRVTFDPGTDTYPLWTPNGLRLIFASERLGARNLFWQSADGTGAVERLTDSPNLHRATAVSPDGGRLIFSEVNPKTVEDTMQVELDGRRRVTPLMQSPFIERNAVISPEGHWLAYEANDSGRLEIYVRPFPDVDRGHWQISTTGGTRPLWSPSGEELFYMASTGALMRVAVERSSTWTAGAPTMLIKAGYYGGAGDPGRTYDIARDGQKFLMLKNVGGADQAAYPTLVVVQNWFEELKRLVPAN